MNSPADQAVWTCVMELAKTQDGREELHMFLGWNSDLDEEEIARTVQALEVHAREGQPPEEIESEIHDAIHNALNALEPVETIDFDSGACGGGDLIEILELPNGVVLRRSLSEDLTGPYASIDEARPHFG